MSVAPTSDAAVAARKRREPSRSKKATSLMVRGLNAGRQKDPTNRLSGDAPLSTHRCTGPNVVSVGGVRPDMAWWLTQTRPMTKKLAT